MIKQPLISIVIANYNHGRFLETAIKSVLNQCTVSDGPELMLSTGDVLEMIIVDGGSKDNSVEVIERYKHNFAWWCSEKDNGQSDAFNKGFQYAKGCFGCWLNADDVMLPHSLESVGKFIAAHPQAEWIAGSTVFCDPDMKVLWCSRCARVISFFYKLFPVASVNGPSSFFSLNKFREVGGFNVGLKYVMDTDLWERFAQADIKLYHVKKYLWGFRVHNDSKTSNRFITKLFHPVHYAENCATQEKYRSSFIKRRIGHYLLRFTKAIKGAYWLSYMDTRRYTGQSIFEIKDF